MQNKTKKLNNVLPGFNISLGYTVFYLSIIVLLPLTSIITKTMHLTFDEFWQAISSPRVVASYKISISLSLLAALINTIFGSILAWSIVRYKFIGHKFVDGLIDLPFALPTAVAGIALTAIYAPNGWIGKPLAELGLQVAFNKAGILVALIFIGLPFVVRTVQPILQELDLEQEAAAASLGANRWQVFRRITLPAIYPGLITGFALAFARSLGEYGSVIFIAGNIPMVSEITPLLIVSYLEEYDYTSATSIGIVMLSVSFVLLFAINKLQFWVARKTGSEG
ncbi:MAG: Sulfate transporter, permease protein [Pseudomonadota bacterium]|jgi:sulfate transport system permease protein